MKLSKRSLFFTIISMYSTAILFANTYITNLFHLGKFNNYLMAIMPSIVIISLLCDFKINFEIKMLSKRNIISGFLFIIISTISILLGIVISLINIKALLYLIMIVLLGTLFFNIRITQEDFEKIKNNFYIIFFLVAGFGIIQYIFKFGLTNEFETIKYIGIRGRVISTYHIATVLDKFIIIGLILLSYDLVIKNNFYKIFLYLVGSVALALTFTRAGIVAYFFLTGCFLIYTLIQKRFFNIFIISLSILVIFFIPGYKYAFQSAADLIYAKTNLPENLQIKIIAENVKKNHDIPNIDSDESFIFRDYYENIGFSIIKNYPYTGIGLGNYTYLYDFQNVNDFLTNKINLPLPYMYPHNGYIQTTAEIGILGLIFYLAFFISFIFKKVKFNSLINLYPCLLLLFIFFLGTMTEGLFTTKQYMFIFMIIYPLCCNYQIKNKITS